MFPVLTTAAFLVVPAIAFFAYRLRRLTAAFGTLPAHGRRRIVLRTVCFCLAWLCLLLAAAGIRCGTRTVAVQKNGAAVSMVFDISYSMAAQDAAGGLSRLEAAADFATLLLGRMDGIPVSVVLVKGDGVIALPLTHDFDAVRVLLGSLTPEYMTAAGSRLGRGILAAERSFPSGSAHSGTIWLFTDGDETDGSLAESLAQSVRFGIPVALIGLGSEAGTEVLAGDGQTRVHTALRAEKLRQLAQSISYGSYGVSYIGATERNAAGTVLSTLRRTESVAYESRPAERTGLFTVLAIAFFALGIIAGGLRLPVLAAGAALCLCGCSVRARQSAAVLDGTFAYYRSDYPYATARFLQCAEDAAAQGTGDLAELAQYNMGAVYLAQNQDEAAAQRLQNVTDTAPDSVRFAAAYNAGLIAFRSGNYGEAAECFKRALLLRPDNIDAKVNLELTARQQLVSARAAAQEVIPVSEEEAAPDARAREIFSLMRQQETQQWQSAAGSSEAGTGDDY